MAIFLSLILEFLDKTFSASRLKPKLIISFKNLILDLSEKNACKLDDATSPISSTAIKSSTVAEKIFSIIKNLFDKFFEVSRPISFMPKAYIKLLNLMFLLLFIELSKLLIDFSAKPSKSLKLSFSKRYKSLIDLIIPLSTI